MCYCALHVPSTWRWQHTSRSTRMVLIMRQPRTTDSLQTTESLQTPHYTGRQEWLETEFFAVSCFKTAWYKLLATRPFCNCFFYLFAAPISGDYVYVWLLDRKNNSGFCICSVYTTLTHMVSIIAGFHIEVHVEILCVPSSQYGWQQLIRSQTACILQE